MSTLLLALWQVVKPHAIAVGACLGIGLGGFVVGYHLGHPRSPETVEQAQQQVARADQNAKQLENASKKTDSVVVVHAHNLGVSLNAYHGSQVQRDSILALLAVAQAKAASAWDSVTKLEVAHAMQSVQSDFRKCDSVASDCEAYKQSSAVKFHSDTLIFHAKDSMIGARDRVITAWKATQPSLRHRLLVGAAWALVGGITDRIAVHNGH